MRPAHLVVVGGGFSGVAFVVQCARRFPQPATFTVVEPRAELGRGVAFSEQFAMSWQASAVERGSRFVSSYTGFCPELQSELAEPLQELLRSLDNFGKNGCR